MTQKVQYQRFVYDISQCKTFNVKFQKIQQDFLCTFSKYVAIRFNIKKNIYSKTFSAKVKNITRLFIHNLKCMVRFSCIYI